MTIVVVCGVLAFPTIAKAQTSGIGYLFGGPVLVDNIGIRDSATAWQFGGGGEVVLPNRVGFGAELGSIYFPAVTTGCCGHETRADAYRGGIFSLNASYHFAAPRNAAKRIHPFLSGGYSALLGAEPMALWNVGGGIHWWIGRRAGIRLEVRDHLVSAPALLGVRFGVVFR